MLTHPTDMKNLKYRKQKEAKTTKYLCFRLVAAPLILNFSHRSKKFPLNFFLLSKTGTKVGFCFIAFGVLLGNLTAQANAEQEPYLSTVPLTPNVGLL